MRQKQQVVILNDFNVVVFSRNPEVSNTGITLRGQEVITMSKQL